MKLGIFGGTGLIGKSLTKRLLQEGAKITIFSRSNSIPSDLEGLDIELLHSNLPDSSHLEGFTGIINLAGEPILNGRWNEEKKQKFWKSRVNFTRTLINELKKCNSKPEFFIGGSAIGYYGMYTGKEPVLDETSPPGNDFLAQMCVEWEKEGLQAKNLGIRTSIIRIGIVLSPNGGALKQMIFPFKMGLGGPIGSGEQYMSWIHMEDIIAMILHLTQNQDLSGVFNLVAPEPLSNREFGKVLASELNRPYILPVPGFILKLIYGEGSFLVSKGQNVIPKRFQENKFKFKYPDLKNAIKNLLDN